MEKLMTETDTNISLLARQAAALSLYEIASASVARSL